MRVVVYFVCLCILLSGGYRCIYTLTHHHKNACYARVHLTIKKVNLVEAPGARRDFADFVQATLPAEEEYFVAEEEEDEDTKHASGRKNKLLLQGDESPSYTFILRYLYGCVEDHPSLDSHSSYKYITQRALRI